MELPSRSYIISKGPIPVIVMTDAGPGVPPHTEPPPVIVAVGSGLITTSIGGERALSQFVGLMPIA